MDPWSVAECDAAFGELDAVSVRTVQAHLREIDRLLRGLVPALDCGLEYTTGGSESSSWWKGVEAELTSSREIRNEDETTSWGSLDALVTVAQVPDRGSRWLVWTYVAQNCNRRWCPEDPHQLFHEEDEADSALEATRIALAMTSRLVDWLSARKTDEVGYFVHQLDSGPGS